MPPKKQADASAVEEETKRAKKGRPAGSKATTKGGTKKATKKGSDSDDSFDDDDFDDSAIAAMLEDEASTKPTSRAAKGPSKVLKTNGAQDVKEESKK